MLQRLSDSHQPEVLRADEGVEDLLTLLSGQAFGAHGVVLARKTNGTAIPRVGWERPAGCCGVVDQAGEYPGQLLVDPVNTREGKGRDGQRQE